jgi:hypothetical protein
MELGEVGWGDVDWIDLAKDRNRWRALVNSGLEPTTFKLRNTVKRWKHNALP